jgi:ribosome recycling factor
MRTRIHTTSLAALCALLATSACKRNEEARPSVDTVKPAEPAPASAPTATAADSGGLAATAKQWQTLLDSARANIGRDSAATAQTLHSAAATVRREAEEANKDAKAALTRSADELDSLAASVERGTKRTVQSVDSAFARLEQAEALNGLAKATDAWAKQQRERAGEEMQSASDNVEWAAKDAKVKLDAGATKAVADARDIAKRLQERGEVTDEEFRKSIEAMEKLARILGHRIASKVTAAGK